MGAGVAERSEKDSRLFFFLLKAPFMGQPVIVDNERCIREEVQLMKERSAIARFLSGSVSTKLVQHSGCPALVVR